MGYGELPLRGQFLKGICGMGSHWGGEPWLRCMVFFYGWINVLEGELLASLRI